MKAYSSTQPRTEHRAMWPSGPLRRLVRRPLVTASATAAVAGAALLGSLTLSAGTAVSVPSPGVGGVGTVSAAPRLPAGFTETFESRFVHANGIRQHVVVGGDGPPLLLVHGWPENWYAWRFMMPQLAEDYTVVAVDQRGIGRTEKPRSGYDSATLADDLAALMTELGHERFAVVGHDTGYIISYALAADHRDRVERLVVAEIPGPPGVEDPKHPGGPALFVPEAVNEKLWHIPFNRVDDELIIDMVASNADAYYRYEYAIQGGGSTLPNYAIDYYVDLYTHDRHGLRTSFGLYRDWDATLQQNMDRQATKLTIPVLGIGGENSWGGAAAGGIAPAATDVESLTVPDAGHWLAEQAPDDMLAALDDFLAPYRAAAAHTP